MANDKQTELTAQLKRLEARTAKVRAELDAELARPVVPEGWTDVGTPPHDCATVRLYYEARGRRLVAPAYYNIETGEWYIDESSTGAAMVQIHGKPICWQRCPADWLADWLAPKPTEAVAKYPRYFRHRTRFWDGVTAYIRTDDAAMGVVVDRDGKERTPFPDGGLADEAVRRGEWLEITAAQAEAMVETWV